MSKSDNSSPDSENSSNNAIYITIQDTNSEPPIIPDEQLDNENNSNSSSPPKNFSNISREGTVIKAAIIPITGMIAKKRKNPFEMNGLNKS